MEDTNLYEVYNKLTSEQKKEVSSLIELPPNKIKPDPRRVDLTDQQIGSWSVVCYAGHKKWVCICSCSKISKVLGTELRSGRSTSCGHSREAESIVGMYFGYLEVIEKVDGKHHKCICHCGCGGTEKIVNTYDLKVGKVKSCGFNTTRKIAIIGRKFNHWTVLEHLGDGRYKCQCDCVDKTIGIVRRADLESGKSKSCGHGTNRLVDITGQKFGEWTAVRHVGYGLWLCRCSCKNKTEKVIRHTELIRGQTTSCGCKRSETYKNTMIDRYGETAVSKIADPRTIEQIVMIQSADNLKATITKYFDHKPNIYELSEVLGIQYNRTNKLIHEFGLEDSVDIGNSYSHYEDEICDFIESLGIYDIERGNRDILNGQEIDIYIPSHKFAIEFNGTYWHSELYKDKKYHQNKSIAGFKAGIHILHIFEHEWLNPTKKEMIKDIIINKLTQNKLVLYAKRCHVEHVNSKEAIDFTNKYHLQGGIGAEIRYGLYLDNELIGLMTFGRPRFNKEAEFELIRLIWKSGVNVVGGAEKLFKAFITEYKPSSIISYCDISKFNGAVYFKLGFRMNPKEITPPNYVWVNPKTMDVLTRYQTQKHKLIEAGFGIEEDTESSIMNKRGYIKVYDSGNAKFIWKSE